MVQHDYRFGSLRRERNGQEKGVASAAPAALPLSPARAATPTRLLLPPPTVQAKHRSGAAAAAAAAAAVDVNLQYAEHAAANVATPDDILALQRLKVPPPSGHNHATERNELIGLRVQAELERRRHDAAGA
jgi:hypothetical protein